MRYIETLPSTKLKDLILNYWLFDIPKSTSNDKPFTHDIMPESNVSIVFINQPYFKGIRLLGPQTTRLQQQIFPGSTYLGIRFNPWVKMDNIVNHKELILNQTSSSPDFLNEIFKEIDIDNIQNFSSYHKLEDGLSRLVNSKKVYIEPLIKYICLELTKDKKVNEIVREIPLSIRPIQKKFKAITGITMSDFKTIHRFQNTARMIFAGNDNIASAAFKNSYSDHSHFLNTFKKYMKKPVGSFIQYSKNIEIQI